MHDNKFVFLTTPFRSGSGLLGAILNAHSQIGMFGDRLKFFHFCYNRYLPLTKESTQKLLGDVAYRLLYRFDIKIDVEECFAAIQQYPLSQANIYATLVNHIFKNYPSDIIVDKETLSWTKIPDFLGMFPKAKAILIIRDLRDVVVSFKKMTIAPGRDYLIALFNVIDAMDHFLEYQERFPRSFYGIRYEALKLNPEEEMKKLTAFLRVDYQPEMLDENRWTDFRGKKWENLRGSSFYPGGNYKNPMGRWRNLITEEDLFLCEWIGARQMQNFGMKPEGRKISQEQFDRVMEMVTSSPLLRESFKHWCETGRGVQRYPLDPTDPKTWDKKSIANPSAFKNE